MSTATWIAAIATVVVAIGVSIAAWFARTASVALSSQLTAQQALTAQLAEVLRLHARELGQSLDERRRAQACRVFIELNRTMPVSVASTANGDPAQPRQAPWLVTATVRNTSDQPVYDMYVIWQLGTTRMGKPDPVARLLPGEQASFERGNQPADADPSSDPVAPSDPAALNAFLTFRDTAGVRWTVREDGKLSDLAPASP
ncbi:MAG TPA: hypothetical protein VN695_03490 [Streptosporangiaceae bacterium]|nr:hypothetical protein [Streptosporangiaceae bacterium]